MHAVDANTIGLWRLDETEAGDYANIADDSGGGRDFTVTGTMSILGGPNDIGYARWVPGSTSNYASRAGDAGSLALLQGEWSWMGWIYWPGTPGTTGWPWSYSAAGETSATNYQGSLFIGVANQTPGVFWESGSGVNRSAQSDGDDLSVGWHHVAVTVEDEGGGLRTVRFYVDGAQHGSTMTGITAPSGGGSAAWRIGRNTEDVTFKGGLKSAIWITGVLDESTIAAASALATKLHDPSAYATFMHLPFDEAPDVIDLSGLGVHLRRSSGADIFVDPLIYGAGASRLFNGATEYRSFAAHPSQPTYLAAFLDEWTAEYWATLHLGWNSSKRGILMFGDAGPETEADNFSGFEMDTNRTMFINVEHGAGINDSYSSAELMTAGGQYNRHHFAVTKRVVAGSAVYEFYVDGQLIDESSAVTEYTGGTSAFIRIGIGPQEIAYYGGLDDFRLSNVRRSAAEILESYEGGLGDTTAPVITIVSPPAGGGLTPTTPIVLNVTDDIGTAAILVLASYGGGKPVEVVHDGFSFRKGYASSSRIPITDGYQYTVRRDGGWKESPTFEYAVVDLSGNIGVIA